MRRILIFTLIATVVIGLNCSLIKKSKVPELVPHQKIGPISFDGGDDFSEVVDSTWVDHLGILNVRFKQAYDEQGK
jgi:hypothetical protein